MGDELYYNSYKISVHFDSGENLEDYASSGNGNISFFNVTWKEVDSEEIKTSDFYEEHILGFESYWNKESTFHKAVKQNSSLQGNNLIHMYQQRGHTCTDTEILDILPSNPKSYNINKLTVKNYDIPYNFKHSEHYFLDAVFSIREKSNILNVKSQLEFAILKTVSTNSSCNNCFRSLWTLLSGEKKCGTLPSLKSDFMRILFGDKASDVTPLHILYTTAKFPSYRNSEITDVYKTRSFNEIDLYEKNGLFIQRCSLLEKEKVKPISIAFVLDEYIEMKMKFANPKKAIIDLYKDNHKKSGQLEQKDLLIKKTIQLLGITKSPEEIAEHTGLDKETIKKYLNY